MPIANAIASHGVENFTVQELCACVSQEELDAAEVHYGMALNTLVPNGYNLRLGQGRGVMSEATKKRIGDANRGIQWSEEAKQKRSDLAKQPRSRRFCEAQSQRMKGKPLAPEVYERQRQKLAKTYELVDPDGNHVMVTNMSDHCTRHGLSKTKMSSVVNGHLIQHKGWRLHQEIPNFGAGSP